MKKILLKIWIWMKCKIGKISGNIGDIGPELKYVKDLINDPTFRGIQRKGLAYGKDFIDSQYDSITAILRGEDDCDGFNRIVQCYYYNQGYDSYLVSYWAKPFKMSHSTCILRRNKLFQSCDYGIEGDVLHGNIENCVQEIATTYGAEVKAFVAQDIAWNIKEL